MKDIETLNTMEALLAATAQVWAARPDKVAVRDGRQAVTYAMLDARANHMARQLRASGAHAGDFVGYLGATGLPFVVTLMACLKAGFVFLPISPKFPPRSVARILRTVDAKCFVSRLALPADAPAVHMMDLPGDDMDERPLEVPDIPETGLCFASSTSGSTGTPKIVAHTRQAFANFAKLDAQVFELDETSVVGHAGTMWAVSLLTAFSVGAGVTCHDVTQGTPQDLFDWLEAERVTYWFVYPALFRTLTETDGVLPDLKMLMLCGEPVFRRDFDLFERITTPGACFANVYGQQETFSAAIFKIRNGETLRYEKIPAGPPGPENDICIIGDDGLPAGSESIGEITHRSPRVAVGYVGDHERTARVFTTGEDGVRSFATGDLGYLDGNGVLHIVGRKDDQIKIRNFNVQPSDIELEIAPHPNVTTAAVTVNYCARGLPRLACFYEGTEAPEALKAWLSERIPAFMLPQFFIPVQALPRTPTGKVQRNRLVLPEDLAGAHRVPAQSRNEKSLAEIWQQVLGHDDFGMTDNFFDVGGDSLRAMELLLLVNQRLGRQFTLDRVILAGGTIEALAELLDQPAERSQLRMLKPGTGGPHIVVGHVYGGGVTDYLEITRAMGEGIKVSGICAEYSQRSRAFPVQQKAQEAIAQIPADPLPVLMGYSFGGRVAFEIAHLLGAEVRIVLIDPIGPFSEGWYRRLRARVKARFSEPAALGLETFYSGDYSYRPQPLKTKGALLVTCDTSRRTDIDGWTAALDGPVETLKLSGDHWDIVRQANALEIARKVQEWLARGP